MSGPLKIRTAGVQLHTPSPVGQRRALLSHHTGNEYILELDNSNLELFTNCNRKAMWQLVFARAPHRTSALIYGSAIHEALELYYRGERDMEKILSSGYTILNDIVPSVKEWRGHVPFKRAIEEYIKKYSLEDSFDIIKCEESFSLPLTTFDLNVDLPFSYRLIVQNGDQVCRQFDADPSAPVRVSKLHILWSGRIDLIIKDDPFLWVMDHKTTSVEGEQYWKQFNLSQQFTGYVWAARELGHDVVGAIPNVIYGRAHTPTGRSLDFLRNRFMYSTEHTEEWREDIIAIVEDFTSNLIKGFFPKKTTHCVHKFGVCPFHDVCSQPKHLRLAALHSNILTDNVWTPHSTTNHS